MDLTKEIKMNLLNSVKEKFKLDLVLNMDYQDVIVIDNIEM